MFIIFDISTHVVILIKLVQIFLNLNLAYDFSIFILRHLISRHYKYLIGHNSHGHYLHAEDLSVNNYVRENNDNCGIRVRE